MANQLEISAINVVVARADEASAATDRPIKENELETLGVTQNFLAARGFEGKLGQTVLLPEQDPIVIAVGLGGQEITEPSVRSAAASLWRASKHLDSITSLLPLTTATEIGAEVALQATVEGMLLASYRYDELKGSPEERSSLQQLSLIHISEPTRLLSIAYSVV